MSCRTEQVSRAAEYLPLAVLLLAWVISIKYVNSGTGPLLLLGCGRFVALGGAGIYLLMISVDALRGRLPLKSFRSAGVWTICLGAFSMAWVIVYDCAFSYAVEGKGTQVMSRWPEV